MRNLKSKLKKLAKKKIARKDYQKKINVKRNNWKTPMYRTEEPVMYTLKDVEGKITGYARNGTREVWNSSPTARMIAGEGILPPNRTARKNRRQKADDRKMFFNKLSFTSAKSR